MRTLTIFYDPSCGLCCQFREWLERQAMWVATEFVGYKTPEAADRFPEILEVGAAKNCVVLADDGRWWQGADAWIVCLWATREFRIWSHRLAGPIFKPVVGSVVHLISGNRLTLSKLMRLKSDSALVEELKRHQPECEGGGCALPHLAKIKNTYKAWK